ncbi:MAG: squalene synthase HpnC [Gammaproteobacteria bacterium]|nr:squalene synthase HpnC [Gammaproteobacteria bacterium]
MLSSEKNLQTAYDHCLAIAQNHYENFPVASRLLNKQLRQPISAVYAFARTADDFADEGKLSRAERLNYLEDYSSELKQLEQTLNSGSYYIHNSDKPIFIALADVIQKYRIPINLFQDLLSAFKSDVNKTRYANFAEILAYCRNSANPVGRILLYLNNSVNEENLNNSDAICTGLQLINFYQDIAQDLDENDRVYLPLDELAQFTVTVDDIKKRVNNAQTQALMTLQLQRARNLYESGKPLCFNLSGRFALELRMIFAGGSLILDKLEANISTLYLRPRLTAKDKIKILWQGFFSSR